MNIPRLLTFLVMTSLLVGETQAAAPREERKPPRLDRYGDPLPPGAVARMGSVLYYHGTPCTVLAFSPDGKIIAVSGGGGSSFNIISLGEFRNRIRLLDAATGRQLHQLRGHSHTEYLRFSPDGKRLISKGDDGSQEEFLKIWDVSTGKGLHRLEGRALSHDGKTLLIVEWGKDASAIRFVNVATGKERRRITVSTKNARLLVAAPDDKTLAGYVDDVIYIWDAATGKTRHRLAGIKKVSVDRLAYSPTGETVVANFGDGTVKLWDVDTGKELHHWNKSTEFGRFYPVYSPDGKTLAGAGENGTIQLWDIKTGRETSRIKAGRFSPEGVAFSPDGRKLAWGTAHNEYSVHLWDLIEKKEVHSSTRLPVPIEVIAFSPEGKTLLTSGRRGELVRSWETATGKELRQFARPKTLKTPILSPSGRWCAVQDKKLRLFDLSADKEIVLQGDLTEYENRMAFSPDGRTLAVCTDKEIRLWDTASGKQRRSLAQGAGEHFGLSFSGDGQTLQEQVFDDKGRRIKFWDMATGKLLRNVKVPVNADYLAVAPDGRFGAGVVLKEVDPAGIFVNDVRILLWDLKTGERLHELRADISRVFQLSFSPDSRSLACVYEAGGVIRLWETATGQERRRFEGHRQLIRCLAFSADGSLLATGAEDHTALVWDVFGRLDNGPVGQSDLSAEQLRSLWTDLAAKDAAAAYRSLCRLLAGKQTAAFLRQQMKPVSAIDARQRERLSRYIDDLDSPQFEAREKAMAELERLGEPAELALRAVLMSKPSLEVRRRAEPLVEKLAPSRSPQRLQALRAVELLEAIGTAEAQELLKVLAGGIPEAPLDARGEGITGEDQPASWFRHAGEITMLSP